MHLELMSIQQLGFLKGSLPKQCEGFTFRKSILIGWTDMTQREVRGVMEKLYEEYKGNAYNLIAKNCNHFCNDACVKLTGNPIPSWVNCPARIGFLCRCVIPANFGPRGNNKEYLFLLETALFGKRGQESTCRTWWCFERC